MIKNSSFDFSYDYLRFDTTWLFEWNYEQITDDTIKFYPFTETGNSTTWKFRATADESGKEPASAIIKHDEFVWDALEPWLEYHEDEVKKWDASHPKNPTRYLSPGSSFITITNSIETVVIDNVPPAFVSDKGTEYVWICDKKTRRDVKRHCEFIFRDQAGLDFKNFEVTIPASETDPEIVIYKYDRKKEPTASEENPNPIIGVDPLTNMPYIDEYSLKISSDGFHTYKVQFDLLYGASDPEVKRLNDDGLAISVWDKAGNVSTYTFGGNGSEKRKWVLIDSMDDISELQPLVIKFYDHDPANRVVDENSLGSVWVSVYNPNTDFWPIDIMAGLAGPGKDEQPNDLIHDMFSGADIDISTYDDSQYATTGVIRFKVINIAKGGNIDIEAWLHTGVKIFDDMIQTSTYAIESDGPWIVMDSEGRKYNIQRYVPKYLRNTDYFEFIKFFELYLNTVYTNMTKGTNISILEKIAKIGDFNDIDRIEHGMIWHYAKQFGMEYNIDLQTMIDLNLGFSNPAVVKDANGQIIYEKDGKTPKRAAYINGRTEDDVIDILKYALKNLPMYNQLKGSVKGMVFAMKMFSLSCKVINLWCKLGPEVEEHPDFVEEDRMFDFTSHFLTSRFNLEFNSLNVDFPTFNDNLEVFVRFIKSIKPIVRILNLIKYTIIFEYDLHWLVNPYVHDDFEGQGDDSYLYTLTWKNEELAEMIERTRVDWRVMHATRLWVNFVPHSIATEKTKQEVGEVSPADMENAYTLLSTMINESRHKFIFKMNADYDINYEVDIRDKYDPTGEWTHETTYDLDVTGDTEHFEFIKEMKLTDIDITMCDSGFYIYPKDGEMATHLAEFVKPVYYLENYAADKADEAREQLIAAIMADDELTEEQKAAAVNRVKTRLEIRIRITNLDDCADLTMTTQIRHVPGTEICYCEPLE